MANPSKAKGSRFESAFEKWWTANVGPCHRMTLHGRDDHGDVGGISVNGLDGIVECKNYSFRQKDRSNRRPTAGQLAKWFCETEAERRNSCADIALLVVHRPGCADRANGDVVPDSFGRNWCWVSARTMELLGGVPDGEWVETTVGAIADMCR